MFVLYDHAYEWLFDGTMNYDDETVTAMVTSAGYTPSLASDSSWSDISVYEVDADGYASASVAQTNVIRDVQVGSILLTASDIVFTSLAPMDAKYCVLKVGDDRLLGYFDMNSGGGALSATNITLAPPGGVLGKFGPERQPGAIGFATDTYSVDENDGAVTLELERSGGAAGATIVSVETVDGTASAGVDYGPVNTEIEFTDGQTQAFFNVSIIDNQLIDGDRSFSVNITGVGGAPTIGTHASATVTIFDNDAVTGYLITHYATADAVGGGDGSQSNPWTYEEALANAQAGDVVQWGPGVATRPSSGERYIPAWQSANSGTSGNPIVFVAQNRAVNGTGAATLRSSGVTELRNGVTTMGDGCPTIGAFNRSYVIWDGFYVNEANSASTADTGPAVLWSSNHCELRRCYITGGGAVAPWFDNHNGVRMENTTGCKVLNSVIRDIQGGSGRNVVAFMLYNCTQYTIRNCYITGVASKGVYIKGNAGIENKGLSYIQNNLITAGGGAFELLDVIEGATNSDVHIIAQNVCASPGNHINMNLTRNDKPRAFWIVNNTFYGGDAVDGLITWADRTDATADLYSLSVMRNNAFVPDNIPVHGGFPNDWTIPSRVDIDRNGYWNYSAITRYSGGTLSDWQSLGNDANAITSDPLFEDAANGDFRLQAGSPYLDAGTDVANLLGGGTSAPINIGAYITDDMSDSIGVAA